MSTFGGGDQSTTQETKLPEWVEKGGEETYNLSKTIADRPYPLYTGPRVSPLAQNQQSAITGADSATGAWAPFVNTASTEAAKGGSSFLNADMSQYMSPYIKGALDPAAREINEQSMRNINQTNSTSAMRGAFGGARTGIAEGENEEKRLQAMSDLYGRGYQSAYESGSREFGADRDASARAAGQYGALGSEVSDLASRDVSNLMTTGALDRAYEQAQIDVPYDYFREFTEWPNQQLDTRLRALSGTPVGATTTTTPPGTDPFSQLLGAGVAALGFL